MSRRFMELPEGRHKLHLIIVTMLAVSLRGIFFTAGHRKEGGVAS